jgi:predicted lysophospholipase L1 biosynthesis ABC-type transport system permease subunit
MKEEYAREVQNGQFLTAMSVFIFTIMIIVAIAYSVNIKIRTGLHSYMLIRAIGANKKTVTNLIASDTMRLIIKGSVTGIAFGLLVPVLLVKTVYTSLGLMQFLILPSLAAVVVLAVMLCLGFLATRKPIKNLLREDIALAINTVAI